MLDFPAYPTNGQQFAAPNGVVYQYTAPPNIWTTAFVGSTLPIKTTASPEEFGAVGNGSTDDGTAIHAWLQYCNANNLKAVVTAGKRYKLPGNFGEYIRVPFDGTGAEFHCSNDGQGHNAVFIIESAAADVEEILVGPKAIPGPVTPGTVNSWTGLYRSSHTIPQLTQRGWSYSFYTTDEVILQRNGGPGTSKGEAFETVNDQGKLSKPLLFAYPVGNFNQVTCYRRRIRPRMVVEGLTVRLTTADTTTKAITNITKANPAVVTCPGHGFPNGTTVYITGVVGMTQVNNVYYDATYVDANTFRINVDTSGVGYTAYTSGGLASFGGRNRMLDIYRPHTTLRNCVLINDTARDCAIGYNVTYATNTVFEGCIIENLAPQKLDPVARFTTCYGFGGGYTDDVTWRNCSARNCRRDIDAGPASNYKIDGGSYPDGVGGHWIDGMHIYGRPFISNQHPTNPHCILTSGSDINVESALIHLPPESNVLTMRGDLPEMRGLFRLGPGVEIIIDETQDPVGVSTQRSIISFPKAMFDCLRPVSLPTRIELRAVIRAWGGASDNNIALLYIQGATAAASGGFPQPIAAPMEIEIAPSIVAHESGFTLASGLPRFQVLLGKCATQFSVGGPTKVRVSGIRCVQVTGVPSAVTTPSDGRYDFHISDIPDVSDFAFINGAVRNSLLTRVNTASTFNLAGGTTVGDEQRRWDATVESGSYTPTLTGVANITSVTPLLCYYSVVREGPQTHVEVHGQITCTPTAGAGTATTLGISLPVPTTFTVAGQLSGSAVVFNGTLTTGITADTTNSRASMAWASNTATPTANHFSARFRYRVA
jgi:hypothetical protein